MSAETGCSLGSIASAFALQYIPGGACRLEGTRARLASHIEHQEAHGFSKWAVVERPSGAVIGDCSLKFLDDGPDVDLGFHLARQ